MIPSLLLLGLLQATSPPRVPLALSLPAAARTGAFLLQDSRPLRIVLEGAGGLPALVIGPVLGDRELADAARSGLPVRLRLRVELWRDQFMDQLVASTSWSTVLVLEPLSSRFFVRSTRDDQRSRVFTSFDAARAAVERDYPLRSNTRREGGYYYTTSLDIETLSISDLQELERWLQGDLQPAVGGDQSIPGAIGKGAKRLLIRVLGMPNRHYEARSPRFHIQPPGE